VNPTDYMYRIIVSWVLVYCLSVIIYLRDLCTLDF